MNLEQSRHLLSVLEHDFDVYYETADDMIERKDFRHLVSMLNKLDAIIEGIKSFGGTGYGDFFEEQDLVDLINSCPAEVYYKSNIQNRFVDDEFVIHNNWEAI